MRSKWYELRPKARFLRRRGYSLRHIEHRLGIPRSTLSGWLKHIQLSKTQSEKLQQDWKNALVKARVKAVVWHNTQKELRLREAESAALKTLQYIDHQDKHLLELALAILYLGEGFKKTSGAGIGNSDPELLKFFIVALNKIYAIESRTIKCQLHLRADQSPTAMKKYWSKQLRIPQKNFTSVMIDRRTVGTKTYAEYKGVCILRCGGVAIQRKLIYLGQLYVTKVLTPTVGG